jgi:lysophospholipase L1-like esterase
MRTLLRRNPWATNLILLALSLTVALAAAELVLRVLFADRFEVHPRGLYSADPVVGYAPTPRFAGSFLREEFEHDITIAASGLRGAEPRPRGPRTYRIVCLGDSFTFGLGVANDEAYPHRLEERLSLRFPGVDVQVLNAGVPGYGTADELRFFESRIEQLDPDLVIQQFLAENDFNDNRQPALGRVELRDGWLHAEEPSRPQPQRTIEWVKRHSFLARLVSNRVGYFAARLGLAAATDGDRFSEADAARAMDLLGQVAARARTRGAESVFVFATSQTPVVAEQRMGVAATRVVKAAADAAGAGFLDLAAAFRERGDRYELYYPLDGHWTAKGHAAAAEAIAGYIEAEHGDAIAQRASRP